MGFFRLGLCVLITQSGFAETRDAAELSSRPGVEVTAIASPAGDGAFGSSLVNSALGGTWMTWLEPAGVDGHVLRCARFELEANRWGPARVIAEGKGWFVNWADFPVLAVQPDRMTAVWYRGAQEGGESYHAVMSVSADGGATWSEPQPLTHESAAVEFVALQPLTDGRLLAAWLDGRARARGGDHQSLYSRVLDEPGPDVLVAERVCDCCQLALAPLQGGGAILAYRGRTSAEVRDIWTAVFRERWQPPELVHADGWVIAGCPVNGPQLAPGAESAVVAWFTAPERQRRVLAAWSRDASSRFDAPVQIDAGEPLGRVDCVELPNNRALVSWMEGGEKAGIYVRLITRRGAPAEPVLVATTRAERGSGFPRMTLLHTGSTATVLLSYTAADNPSRVATAKIVVR